MHSSPSFSRISHFALFTSPTSFKMGLITSFLTATCSSCVYSMSEEKAATRAQLEWAREGNTFPGAQGALFWEPLVHLSGVHHWDEDEWGLWFPCSSHTHSQILPQHDSHALLHPWIQPSVPHRQTKSHTPRGTHREEQTLACQPTNLSGLFGQVLLA